MMSEVISLSTSLQGMYLLPFVFALLVLSVSGLLIDIIYSTIAVKRSR